jgi:hypothetical protein
MIRVYFIILLLQHLCDPNKKDVDPWFKLCFDVTCYPIDRF